MLKKFTRPLKNFIKYRDSDFDPVEFLIFEDRKLVLLVVSKVACTSIKATIGKQYNIDFKNESGLDIHSRQDWQRRFGKLSSEHQSFEVAAFVRDPFSRLVSCYKDRVIHDDSHKDFSKYYFRNYPFDIRGNCEFSDFVERVSKIPDHSADRHFKMQSYSLAKLGRPLDFIGRFENITEDWKFFARKYDFDPELEKLNPSDRYNKSLKKDYREYYNTDILKKVYQRYERDITEFNYDEIYWQLKNFVE